MTSATDVSRDFLHDLWRGLGSRPRSIPSKYFYDARGSALFDRICDLPEYYLTRAESSIMRGHADKMAALIGPDALLLEYGAGSSLKTRLLLDALESQNSRPAAYVPLDISRQHLEESAAGLRQIYPQLDVRPLAADYTLPFELPRIAKACRVVAYFPGSTLGNFAFDDAESFLRQVRELVGESGALLIGLDLRKPPQVLLPAYNDATGVTAAFNLNLLARANRELEADFGLEAWRHEATWNEEAGRIEMRLISMRSQLVCVQNRPFEFESGDSILTEYSHKYTSRQAARMAAQAGFEVAREWRDQDEYFSVQAWRAR